MPDIDLDPGDYTERKPKGWRWKLPWSHEDDVKLPLVMFCVVAGILALTFMHRDELNSGTLFGVSAMFAFVGGIMFMLWQRD